MPGSHRFEDKDSGISFNVNFDRDIASMEDITNEEWSSIREEFARRKVDQDFVAVPPRREGPGGAGRLGLGTPPPTIERDGQLLMQRSFDERSRARGIDPEGADMGTRMRMAFGDPMFALKESLAQQFSKRHGSDIKPEDVEVRFNQDLGELVFTDPKTGERSVVNRPGLDLGDMAEFAKEAPIIASEIGLSIAGLVGGTAAGGPIGGFVGFVGGGALGSGLGEAAMLKVGKIGGLNNLTDDEIVSKAVNRAAISGMTFAASGALGAVIRKFLGTTRAGELLSDMLDPAKLDEAMAQMRPLVAEVIEQTGMKFGLRPSQMLRETDEFGSEVLQMAEETVGQRGVLMESTQEQAQARAALESRAAGQAAPIGTAAEERLRQGIVLRSQEEATLARMKEEVGVVEAYRAAQQEIPLTTIGAEEAGATARAALERGDRFTRNRWFSSQFEKVNQQADDLGIQIDLDSIIQEAQSLRAGLDKRTIQSLAAEDLAIIDEIGSLGRAIDDVAVPGQPVVQEAVTSPYEVIVADISDLKALSRKLGAERAPQKAITTINKMISAYEGALGTALKNAPAEFTSFVKGLQGEYATFRERVTGGIVGQVIQKDRFGGYRLASEDIIPTILSSQERAGTVALALSGGIKSRADAAMARTAIRDGIISTYRRSVAPKGAINPQLHEEFMRTNSRSMKHFFDRSEMSQFSTADRAARVFADRAAKRDRIVKEINKRFNTSLETFDADIVFNTFKPTKEGLQEVRNLSKLVKDDPDMHAIFQARGRQFIFENAQTTIAGQRRLTANSVAKSLDEWRPVLNELVGPEYAKDLNTLQRAFALTERKAKRMVQGSRQLAEAGPGTLVAEAITRVTVARPLSPAGVALTRALKFSSQSAQSTLAEAISSGEALRRMIALNKVNPTSRLWFNELVSVFGEQVANRYLIEMEKQRPQRRSGLRR